MRITSDQIEALLEKDHTLGRTSEGWYGRLGPFGFRLTEFQRISLPVVGVVIVTGTRLRFELKDRSREDVLRRMAQWVNALNADKLEELADFVRYGPNSSSTQWKSALERLDEED